MRSWMQQQWNNPCHHATKCMKSEGLQMLLLNISSSLSSTSLLMHKYMGAGGVVKRNVWQKNSKGRLQIPAAWRREKCFCACVPSLKFPGGSEGDITKYKHEKERAENGKSQDEMRSNAKKERKGIFKLFSLMNALTYRQMQSWCDTLECPVVDTLGSLHNNLHLLCPPPCVNETLYYRTLLLSFSLRSVKKKQTH